VARLNNKEVSDLLNDTIIKNHKNNYDLDLLLRIKLIERLPYLASIKKNKILYTKLAKQEEIKRIKELRELNSMLRKAYRDILRDKLLDSGLNVKVKVYGKDNTIIELTYVLFDDVWSHKLSKNGTVNSIEQMGFTKLIMTDGYDWKVYWDLNK
jgi:hypothetical protein